MLPIYGIGLLPGESSMSLSPSRLLRDATGQWLESEVQDFSLSSFLAHLDAAGTKAHTELAVNILSLCSRLKIRVCT
ncbi:hypothetical protein EVAR_39564_1 [Eumeta japonica]|uniref:Uncharacterized protein n=1 Tax=Eumeta variegata TaxID=151549 RepID=A0A4C1XLM5_EUMVA|nr:hypothetical protein EVAR_39564_1 [Eumeta japonica]